MLKVYECHPLGIMYTFAGFKNLWFLILITLKNIRNAIIFSFLQVVNFTDTQLLDY